MPLLTVGISGQDVFDESSTALHGLGQIGRTKDGRTFKYAKAGASALVVGNALQAPAEDTDHDNITVRATSKGSTELLITTGSSGGALDANEYSEGFAVIDTDAGLGYCYRVAGHAAISASTNGTINLVPEDAIQVALDTNSKVTLVQHPYKNVIQMPASTLTNAIVGGAVYPTTAAYFGWIQTGGPGASRIEDTPAVGQPLTVSDTAGALGVHSAELPNVAYMLVTGRDDKVLPVFWTIGG